MAKTKKRRIIAIALVAIVAVIVIACAVYVGDYYHAAEAALAAAPAADGTLVFGPSDAAVGLIFYPGGKVEHSAYAPLMQACAEEGILCVLVEMPFRLAVLDLNAADGIAAQYPDVERWYLGGHSLGGSMAAAYLESHAAAYDGLILLGSYSTADLSQTGLQVLSIYGSEDQVLNREKYDENRSNLPADFTELVIEGGCHAYFGMYGPQAGDGTPHIENETQITLTTQAIAAFTQP